MPNKKKNNQARNPFYFFMVSLRPQLERQGVVLENGMRSLAEIAGPRWKELPEHEKEVYQEMARQDKANKKYRPARNDKMDCTGEYISRRVDTVSLNEKRRKEEREEVKRGWLPGRAICDEKFYMIGFMSLYDLPDEGFLPCELGVVEYSLNGGIMRKMHYFIKPGEIRVGLRYTAVSTSERTHQIPVEGLAKRDDSHHKIWLDLLRFVNPEQTPIFPPVYCRISETKQTEYCLQWLARKAEMPNKLKKVYELEGVICDLHSHFTAESGSTMGISKSKATELISSTIFDYEPNSRCDWHEKQEVKFCALGTVLRYCYCISDFLCSVYGIPLTPNHVPERPDGVFCTVIKPADSKGSSSREETQPRYSNRPVEDNRPFASRDYCYSNGGARSKGLSSNQGVYTRSGPTYDQQSLHDDSDDDTVYTRRAQAPPQSTAWQFPQSRQAQAQQPTSTFGVGRGRGRGRGIQLSQPLRRPNIPGMAARGVLAHQETSWSSIAITNKAPPLEGNTTAWAGTDFPPHPVGRGASRPLNNQPRAYAGALNPPAAAQAPMPPTAWQQPAWQQPAWRPGGGVASQMSSLSLDD
ncbi:unnamed protein product [Pocillopora meandrina]|uniref:HMG box domain-containing protein n=1 Tax=Pocillopora meandrina TaxID=46732 RepID=A0AAU9WMT1_9CNID|nr:unnamed protein product [Pocillopora meandrina]